ncbi:MAG: hypothetical protein IJB70_04565 [Clostridia bacterium]|nr:hypothetical protein [Clostridia bacterium]
MYDHIGRIANNTIRIWKDGKTEKIGNYTGMLRVFTNHDNTTVYYIAHYRYIGSNIYNEEGDLYKIPLIGENKGEIGLVANNVYLVVSPIIIEDGSVVYPVWNEEDYTSAFHLFANGKDTVIGKGDNRQYSYGGYSNDAKVFYYVSDSSLYMINDGETKLIADDVYSVAAMSLYR